jgi:predicted double-glycine peptidase
MMEDTTVGDEEIKEMNELFLPVRPREQQHSYSCGPVALRILVRYISGIDLTENDMIFLTGATEDGSSEYNLMRALDILGFKYTQSDKGNFNRLKKHLQDGQPSIVHLVMNDGGGHYMVFCGYDEENVRLADPATGKIVKYGLPYFLGVWKVEEGETQTRWYLSITGHVGDKMDSQIARLKRIQKKVRSARK